jgi:hypothetical protein
VRAIPPGRVRDPPCPHRRPRRGCRHPWKYGDAPQAKRGCTKLSNRRACTSNRTSRRRPSSRRLRNGS